MLAIDNYVSRHIYGPRHPQSNVGLRPSHRAGDVNRLVDTADLQPGKDLRGVYSTSASAGPGLVALVPPDRNVQHARVMAARSRGAFNEGNRICGVHRLLTGRPMASVTKRRTMRSPFTVPRPRVSRKAS